MTNRERVNRKQKLVNFLIPELGDIKKKQQQKYQEPVQNKSKYFIWCVAKPQNFLKAFVLDVKQVSMVIMWFLGSATEAVLQASACTHL